MAWIERRGNKYRVVWDTGTPDERARRVETYDAWEDADKQRKKIDYQDSLGIVFDPSKMTVAEYFDYWLKLHGDKLAPKTLQSYRCEISNHIKPRLGKVKVSKLKPLQLQNYYARLLTDGRADLLQHQADQLPEGKKRDKLEKRIKEMKSRGLSTTTVRYQHRIIHKALQQAVKWQMVARNIADAVELPKPVPPQIEYLRREDIHSFIKTIKASPDYPAIATAIFTGMRQGELLGLRWQDIDLDRGVIHIRQQLQYLGKGGYLFKEPKRESKRDIPMPLPLNAIFRQADKEQNRLKGIYSDNYIDHDLIFCNPNGSPMDGTGLTKRFQSLLVKANLPRIRFHALRHTVATMCRAAGMELADIQDLLGHADISTTKKMYTHIEIETLRRSMDKLTEYLEIEA
jgi:integrase